MSIGMAHSLSSSRAGNLSPRERWLSTLAGAGLTLAAFPRGRVLRRLAFLAAGVTLTTRGLGGYCGMKAALAGKASLGEGFREQWQRVRAQLGIGAGGIGTLRMLYVEALQELVSSAAQLARLLGDLERGIEHPDLLREIQGYATQVRSRKEDLERLLEESGAGMRVRRHADQAMRALVEETRKMCQVASAPVRDAALVDSLQRLIHYQIAAYGSVASYAKALTRDEDAARLAAYADRDKSIDAELTEMAKEMLNPRAAAERRPQGAAGARTH